MRVAGVVRVMGTVGFGETEEIGRETKQKGERAQNHRDK